MRHENVFNIDWDDKGMQLKFYGDITIHDLIEAQSAVYKDERLEHAEYGIVDFSDVDAVFMHKIDTLQLAVNARDSASTHMDGLRIAMVAQSDYMRAVIRAYIQKLMIFEVAQTTRLFSDVVNAKAWAISNSIDAPASTPEQYRFELKNLPYETHWEEDGVHQYFHGDVTAHDVISSQLELYRDLQRHEVCYVIIDWSEVNRLSIGETDIAHFIIMDTEHYSNSLKVALVSPHSYAKKLFHTFMRKLKQVSVPLDVQLFTEPANARAWAVSR